MTRPRSGETCRHWHGRRLARVRDPYRSACICDRAELRPRMTERTFLPISNSRVLYYSSAMTQGMLTPPLSAISYRQKSLCKMCRSPNEGHPSPSFVWQSVRFLFASLSSLDFLSCDVFLLKPHLRKTTKQTFCLEKASRSRPRRESKANPGVRSQAAKPRISAEI